MITTMEGYIAAAGVWYLLVTTFGVLFGIWFNWWIHTGGGKVTATCWQVVIGVTVTEALRIVRALPLVCVLAQICGHNTEWWVTPMLLSSGWVFDAGMGYAATGIPMIYGNLKGRAAAREDGPGAIVAEATQK